MRLLRRQAPRRARRWHSRIRAITKCLVKRYGTPSLGNFRDPVNELIYIVLSAKTSESNCKKAHARLSSQFPRLEQLARSPLPALYDCVGLAGLGSKRASHIKGLAARLLHDLGDRPSNALRKLTAASAFDYLCTLPGVGPKSALCVLMYSFGLDVFPVDAHVTRVLSRVGALGLGAKHYFAQALLPAFVPAGLSKKLHVALVVHGRQVCKPQKPACLGCPIRRLCNTGKTQRGLTGHARTSGTDDNGAGTLPKRKGIHLPVRRT